MAFTRIKYLDPDTVLGIWRMDEPESFFLRKAPRVCVNPEKAGEIHHAKRRCEWLASRYMVSQLTKLIDVPFTPVYNDEFGKPHMSNSEAHISISHAEPYVAVMVHRNRPCGIDIESLREKVQKLAPKFLNDEELKQAEGEIRNLTILWGAKEALYKLHGRKQLIFKENLNIREIEFGEKRHSFEGDIIENGATETVQMNYFSDVNYVMVTAHCLN